MSALTPQIELSNYENLKSVNENFLKVLEAEKKQILNRYLFEKVDLGITTEKLNAIKNEVRQTNTLIKKYNFKIEEIKQRIAKQ